MFEAIRLLTGVGIECIAFGAGKIWSGLLKDHYAPIWEMLLEAMRTEVATGVAMDAAALSHAQFAFSAAWVRQTVRVKSARLFCAVSSRCSPTLGRWRSCRCTFWGGRCRGVCRPPQPR